MSTATYPVFNSTPLTFRARYAQRLTREKIYRELVKQWKLRQGSGYQTAGIQTAGFLGSPGPPKSAFDLPPDRKPVRAPPPPGFADPAPIDRKFCIVGAGVAGLFLAMMLSDLHIPYDLLEASDRIGGRIYTKHFSDIAHDYYDIGAMRYPKIPLMNK
jgi:hypothetical protein